MKPTAALRIVVVLLLLAPAAVGQQVMYARTATEVREGRSLSAPVVARLQQGQPVRVVETVGRHYRVSVQGRQGWIYFNKLAEQRPEDISDLLATAPATRGMELTEVRAGGALRGLSPLAEKYAAGAEVPDWAAGAVDKMQSLKVTESDLAQFARSGGLGEYAEVGR